MPTNLAMHKFVVQDVKQNNDNNVTLKISCHHEELYDQSSLGIGIAGSLSKNDLDSIKARLVLSITDIKDHSEKLLTPCIEQSNKGPNYASPSNEFLTCLLEKATNKSRFDLKSDLFKRTACLYYVMTRDQGNGCLLEKFKDNYSVQNLLMFFSGVVSPENISDLQPKENGNKTYAVYDIDPVKKTFHINVQQETPRAFRACFGELPHEQMTTKPGQCSTYLISLKPGDTIAVNSIKQGPQLPKKEELKSRDILFMVQGNAVARVLSLLEEITNRKTQGEDFGKVILIYSATNKDKLIEMENIHKYIDTKVLSEAHFCLSREVVGEDGSKTQFENGVTHHIGQRITPDIVENLPVNNPFILAVGGQGFTGETTKNIIEETTVYDYLEAYNLRNDRDNPHSDLRLSSSSDRRGNFQGEKYQPVEVDEAVKEFKQSLFFLSRIHQSRFSDEIDEFSRPVIKRSLSCSTLDMRFA